MIAKAIEIGDKILYRIGPNKSNHKTYHVRGFVDKMLIVRWWSRRYQSWMYEAIDPAYIITSGYYSLRKGKK